MRPTQILTISKIRVQSAREIHALCCLSSRSEAIHRDDIPRSMGRATSPVLRLPLSKITCFRDASYGVYEEVNIDYSTDPISAAKWHSVLKDAEHVTFFQTHEWMQILKHSFGYRDASRICSIDGIEALIPMVKKRRHIFTVMDSLPIGYGGPISPQETPPEVISALAQSIIMGKKHSSQPHPPSHLAPAPEREGERSAGGNRVELHPPPLP